MIITATNVDAINELLELAKRAGQFVTHAEYLCEVVGRIGEVAERQDISKIEIPSDACTIAELSATLGSLVEIMESITPVLYRLDDALPRLN